MTPVQNEQELPQTANQSIEPATRWATTNQRLGLAIVSLAALVFLLNIMAALSPAFGPVGATIGFVAICVVILGVNVAFNFDLLRRG